MNTEDIPPSVHQVRIDTSGRIALPAVLRERLGLTFGDSVLVIEDDGEIRIETATDALKEAQAYMASLVAPGVSLADELISERRKEAANE